MARIGLYLLFFAFAVAVVCDSSSTAAPGGATPATSAAAAPEAAPAAPAAAALPGMPVPGPQLNMMSKAINKMASIPMAVFDACKDMTQSIFGMFTMGK